MPFQPETFRLLGNYVYGLIECDRPFYIGRGIKNRCYDHIDAARKRMSVLANSGEELSDRDGKFSRIRSLLNDGRDVRIVIYRFGMSVAAAKEVEAVLIETFGTYEAGENRNRGYQAERGRIDADELNRINAAPDIPIGIDEIACVCITSSVGTLGRSVAEAASYCWSISAARRRQRPLLLAYGKFGLVEGVFRVLDIILAEDFRQRDEKKFQSVLSPKWAFVLDDADPAEIERYLKKRIPADWRQPSVTYPQ